MATLSVVLDGTPLHTPGGAFQVSDPQNGPDWGSQAVADVLLTGQYRAEELDQVAAEAGLTRTVTIPLKVDAASADQLVTLQQTLTSTLARASKYAPLTLTVTPENSTHVSTFKVWGGSWSGRYDNVALAQNLAFGTLTLLCYWPVYGAAQNLGSSGAPLITNTVSPAAVTLTPSPAGDIPADVTLFVKNRAAVTQNVQTVTVNATGGTFTLTYPFSGRNFTTASIFWNAAASSVESSLRGAIASIYAPNTVVAVSGSAGGPYTVTFSGVAQYNPVGLVADSTSLTGGTHTASVAPAGSGAPPITSMIASTVSGNTGWVMNKAAAAWAAGADGALGGGTMNATAVNTSTILSVGSFTTPTLPSDLRFRIWLRAAQAFASAGNAPAEFRLRVVTGQAEVIGEWRTPPNPNTFYMTPFAADMGGFQVPVSELGVLGAGSTTTTVFVEARGNDSNSATLNFYEALFLPDDSTVIVETPDTGKALAANGAAIQLETDQVYDSSGNAAGGVVTGAGLRSLGASRFIVYTSQQYLGNMNVLYGYAPEKVDVWATLTPRYIGLA